jgi:hypothetical protein
LAIIAPDPLIARRQYSAWIPPVGVRTSMVLVSPSSSCARNVSNPALPFLAS